MTTFRERPLVFGRGLVGIVTEPVHRPAQATGIVLHNAGLLDRCGAHRMNVDAARTFADAGFASLRFDLSGLGDSAPRQDRTPFAESSVEETRLAMDALAEVSGARRFVPMGLCSGADQSFQTCLADERAAGGVWIDGYPYSTAGFRAHRVLRPLTRMHTWRRLLSGQLSLDAGVRVASAVPEDDPGLAVRDIPPRDVALAGIEELLSRGARLCVVYTAGQLGSYNHAGQFFGMYPELRGRTGIDYRYFANADHTFTLAAARAELIAHVDSWLARYFAGVS